MQQIAATRRRDRLLQQIALCDMWKSLSLRQNFVAAICRTNWNWFEFVRHIAATYRSDKLSASDLLQQQCRQGDLSPGRVATICRIVCLGLNSSTGNTPVAIKKSHSHGNSLFSSPHPRDLDMRVIFGLKNVKQCHKLKLTYFYAYWIMHMNCY